MARTQPIRRLAMVSSQLRPLASRATLTFNRASSSLSSPRMIPILSKNAMSPVGPYSQAIKTDHAIYCSGQLPATSNGTIVEGSMGQKTAACLQALDAVLVEAGSSLERIVKVQIFLTDMNDFTEMNTEYEKWIKHKPARSCVAVKALPKGVNIEIECVALPGEDSAGT